MIRQEFLLFLKGMKNQDELQIKDIKLMLKEFKNKDNKERTAH
jgi:hypothetical protein